MRRRAAACLLALLLAPVARGAEGLRDGERRLPLGGVAQWVRVAGARHLTTPLVVVHGGPGGNHWVFERTVGRELERFATVVYWEQRGSGRSDAPADPGAYSVEILVRDLEALRAALGAPRISLLGYSFGGTIAAEYALAFPDRVERLVLQAPAHFDAEWMGLVQLHGFLAVARGELRERVAALLSETGRPAFERSQRAWDAADAETVDRLLFEDPSAARRNREMWRESGLTNTGALAKAVFARPPSPLLPRAASIRAPTLVLVGRHDRNVGVDACRDLADVVPHGWLRVFERSAHFPDLEEPAAWTRAVREFLAGGAKPR
jgi:proline iminopeptidase